jgi:hypothetical protein
MYIDYSTLNSLYGWKNYWFYIRNHAPPLPRRMNEAPMPKDYWKSEVKEEEMPHVWVLLEKICEMKKAGVSGATVMLSWLQRHIQTL